MCRPLFSCLIRRPTISPLFPYTTLFRSRLAHVPELGADQRVQPVLGVHAPRRLGLQPRLAQPDEVPPRARRDRKSTRLNSSHLGISYAVFCLKKKKMPKADRTCGIR